MNVWPAGQDAPPHPREVNNSNCLCTWSMSFCTRTTDTRRRCIRTTYTWSHRDTRICRGHRHHSLSGSTPSSRIVRKCVEEWQHGGCPRSVGRTSAVGRMRGPLAPRERVCQLLGF